VLNLTAIFGFLIYLTIVLVADVRWRALLSALLAVPILFIGVARVYDGAHWASDTLGGYMIGGIWLALTIQLYRWIGTRIEARHRARALHHGGSEQGGHAEYNTSHDGEITRPGDAPA
jgi:membrane-associated phospholipid phosphatase